MHNPLTKTTTLYLSQPPGRHQRGRWATLIREVQEGIVRSTRGDRSESESPTDPAQPKLARNATTAETPKPPQPAQPPKPRNAKDADEKKDAEAPFSLAGREERPSDVAQALRRRVSAKA